MTTLVHIGSWVEVQRGNNKGKSGILVKKSPFYYWIRTKDGKEYRAAPRNVVGVEKP